MKEGIQIIVVTILLVVFSRGSDAQLCECFAIGMEGSSTSVVTEVANPSHLTTWNARRELSCAVGGDPYTYVHNGDWAINFATNQYWETMRDFNGTDRARYSRWVDTDTDRMFTLTYDDETFNHTCTMEDTRIWELLFPHIGEDLRCAMRDSEIFPTWDNDCYDEDCNFRRLQLDECDSLRAQSWREHPGFPNLPLRWQMGYIWGVTPQCLPGDVFTTIHFEDEAGRPSNYQSVHTRFWDVRNTLPNIPNMPAICQILEPQ